MNFVHYWAVWFWCDTLQWRHMGVMAPQVIGKATVFTKENIKICVTCLLWGEITDGFPHQRASNAEMFLGHNDIVIKVAQKRRFETKWTKNCNFEFPNYCFAAIIVLLLHCLRWTQISFVADLRNHNHLSCAGNALCPKQMATILQKIFSSAFPWMEILFVVFHILDQLH